MKDGVFEDEVNNLIEWCEDLDYEQYTKNWHNIATSNIAELPFPAADENPFQISGEELGGFSFQANPQIMALQQELGAQGVGIDLSNSGGAPQFT